jgi:hypothetical protein
VLTAIGPVAIDLEMTVGAPTEYDLEANEAGAYDPLGAAQLADPLKLPEAAMALPEALPATKALSLNDPEANPETEPEPNERKLDIFMFS